MQQQEIQKLLDLLALNGHIDDLVRAAQSASHGQIDEVVYLCPESAISALEKFLAGGISTQELIDWAEVVHSLDAIGVAEEHDDLLLQFLFEISTPELIYDINTEVCNRWISRLRQAIS
ncbi:hypothetical protein PS467_10930 [Streptomyces luomodiensis]|uniref:CdiI immunity protein domain-containing protein n=1 Tax=Streptomyces luomodiensis TaxID=3026192 RepID=A0ABY9UTN1_9ACTN|nr:hypothetical protein [Streptomyces sp. SCA4-21]WNE95806.1 hypothetical protein PS467_10930 [Streptomyces sp. SCA4-21]